MWQRTLFRMCRLAIGRSAGVFGTVSGRLACLEAVQGSGGVRRNARILGARLLSTTTSTSLGNGPDGRRYATATAAKPEEEMFCYQCEQTRLGKACTTIGICGKTPEVAAIQDLLVHLVKGMSVYAYHARQMGVNIEDDLYDFTFSVLFSTITNVNFDNERFPEYIFNTLQRRDQLKRAYEQKCQEQGKKPKTFTHEATSWSPISGGNYDLEYLENEGKRVGVKSELDEYGADVNGVRQMVIYGIKGMASYARHARFLGEWDSRIGDFTHEALCFLCDGPEAERHDLATNLGWALKVGEMNLLSLELLDKGHRQRFGIPSPTKVKTAPTPGKCILVTGHDMNDLYQILKATEGKGVNVYTHGEMMAAHGYPGLRKFQHLAGHFGGAWQMQKFDFPVFPGPIVVTTNCMTEPMKSYKARLFTLNDCGWPGITHLKLPKDTDKIIEIANELKGYTEADCQKESKEYEVGYGHEAVLANAGKIMESLKSGELKRMFVIGVCDGSEHKRNYFSSLGEALPAASLVLTMGCAKYRLIHHEFGTLGTTGIPRLLDMGQCNDSYGIVVIAKALSEATGIEINYLPLSITLSWFEQKAVAVLLSLLHLGMKNIRVGPVLPAFLTPNVVDILVDKYNIIPTDNRHPKDDLAHMMMGDKEGYDSL